MLSKPCVYLNVLRPIYYHFVVCQVYIEWVNIQCTLFKVYTVDLIKHYKTVPYKRLLQGFDLRQFCDFKSVYSKNQLEQQPSGT